MTSKEIIAEKRSLTNYFLLMNANTKENMLSKIQVGVVIYALMIHKV